MKKIFYVWFASIAGILTGGLLLCRPEIIPFAIILIAISAILFLVTGILSIFVLCDYFEK